MDKLACAALLGVAADLAVDVPARDPGSTSITSSTIRPPGTQPQKVAVGGEFNNFSQTEFPMKADGAGNFVTDVRLSEGPHSYRFFVDGAWVNDSEQHSEADLEESNGIKGHNSAVFVGPDGRNLPKPPAGKIAVEGLHFVPGNIRYFDPISPSEARIVFGAQAGNLSGAAVYSQVGQTWRRDPLSSSNAARESIFWAVWCSVRRAKSDLLSSNCRRRHNGLLLRRQVFRSCCGRPAQCVAKPGEAGLRDAGVGATCGVVSDFPRAIPRRREANDPGECGGVDCQSGMRRWPGSTGSGAARTRRRESRQSPVWRRYSGHSGGAALLAKSGHNRHLPQSGFPIAQHT